MSKEQIHRARVFVPIPLEKNDRASQCNGQVKPWKKAIDTDDFSVKRSFTIENSRKNGPKKRKLGRSKGHEVRRRERSGMVLCKYSNLDPTEARGMGMNKQPNP